MNSLVTGWISHNNFSYEKLEFLNAFCPTDIEWRYNVKEWEKLEKKLRTFIPMGYTLNHHHLYVHRTATDLINGLFDKHVDEETLIITSVVEHEAVEKNLARLNRDGVDHIRLHYYNGIKSLNLSQVKQVIQNKPYKKAFVYIIGTQITTGEVTPEAFYVKLKEYLECQGIKTIMVTDDVHGMYLYPRDYSIFDYVICTAHALIRRWDMGLMWSKTEENFGLHCCHWLSGYIQRLDMILKSQSKLFQFSNVMEETFIQYLSLPYIEYMSNSVPHIFSIRVNARPKLIYTPEEWKTLAGLEVRLETQNYEKDNIFYIRMRASQYITFPGLLHPAIVKVRELLERVINVKEEGL